MTSGTTTSWQPVLNWGWRGETEVATGYVSYSYSTAPLGHCTEYYWKNFTYHDPFGTPHYFAGEGYIQTGPVYYCRPQHDSVVATATDGSGYSINANPSATGSVTIALTTSSGKSLSVPQNAGNGSAKTTDRNGNEISTDGSGNFYDTLSSTAATLVVSGTGTVSSPQKFTYTTSTGGSAYYQVNYTNYTVATNFGISGITEYKSAAAVPLVTGVELPDTSQYTFTYETTPGTCAPYSGTTCVTARLKTVTLPTGGMITYTYSGGYDGIFSDGSAAGLMRQTPDGTWTYNRTLGTGSNVGASATLITAPMLSYETNSDQTIEQFQGIYPTQTDVYQGTAPSFSSVPISQGSLQTSGLLQETQTCYNGSANPCTAAPITAAISQRTVATNVAGGTGNLWSEHTDQYNAYGLQTLSEDYDFAATAPGPVLQQTTTSYAALGGSLNAFVQTVEVLNAAGTIQSRQDTTYDQYGSGMGCVTGAPQHDDTDFGCSFTARGNATSVTTYTNPSAPSGGITKNFTYDSTGNLLTAQVNCCELKTWTYLPSTSYAYATSVTSGSSSPQMTTTSTYDLHMGLVLTTTDPNSLTTTMTYDKMGRPLTTAVGTNPATVYTYSDTTSPWTALVCSPVQGTATACQKTVMDSQGRTATIQLLDASSNLYSATDTKYDSWGRAYRVSNPYTGSAAYWTQTNTDALGRTVKSTLQDGSVGASSYTNNTVTTTDPAGKQREGVFDGLGRLTTVYEPDPTNGNSLTLQTSYTYNVFNQLTQVTQGSQTRTYVYDALARLNSSTTPEAGAICLGTYSGSTCQANGYDGWNNLLYRTDARGVVTNYMYDTLNRLVGITYPTVPSGVTPMPNVCEANGATSNNANVCLNYGTSATSYNNGLPMSMTDGSGSESYTYNSLEQISQLQKVIGTTTYTSSYAYNYADELTQITYPSGRVVAQTFDAIGRVCAVGASGSTCSTGTTYATGYTYNAAQQPTAFNYGNTVAASFGYSPDRLQLTSLSYAKSGTSLFALAYSYGTSGSNDGLTSSITDSVQPGRSVSYTYDSLARLSTALTTGSTAYPQWGLSWTYDRYANRTVQRVTAGTGVPSNTVTISASTNQITGSPYTYDASGNMTNDGLNTLVYDAENRTTSATNGSSSGAYTYDGGGLRIKKVAGSIATVYVFSGTKVIAEYDNGAAPTAPSREYVYSGTTLLAKFDSTGTHYYHKDVLSNRVVTDSGGNVYEQLGHYPYGESWYNASNDKLFFTSYERDSESGNDYAQARYYVSRLGRFSSTDPLAGNTGDPQSLNRYVYGRDLPVILVDPSGQDGDCPQETRRKRWIDREDFGGGMVLFPSEMEEIFAAQDPTGICGGGGGGDVGGGDDPPTVDNGNPPIPPPEPESGCPPGADSCVTVSGTDPLADCAGNIGACMASIDEELVTGSGGGNSALGLLKLALQKANCAALLGGSAKAAQLLAHFNGTTMVSPNTKYSDQNTAQAQNVLYGPQQQNPGGATTPVPDGGNFQNGNWATTGGFTTYFGNVASGYSPSAQATVLVHEFMHAGSTGSTIETAAIDMVTPNVPGQQKSNITANIYQIQKNCGTALPPGY